MTIEQVQIIEESIDGVEGADEYEYDSIKYLGVEMSDTPILAQKLKVKSYFVKKRAKQLYVELKKPNYNLQRGMLINVIIDEYNTIQKRSIIENMENSMATEVSSEDSGETETPASAAADAMLNESVPVPNTSLSGLYYVDQVGFRWEKTMSDISQYFFLIKKGMSNNLVNKYAPSKI